MLRLPENWPPTRQDIFLQATPHRPIFQGDLFAEAPMVKPRPGDRPGVDPKVTIERRLVMALTYPCEMYEGSILARVQTAAVAREASKLRLSEDWSGPFHAFPLPDVLQDGTVWAADFRTIGTMDRSYLTLASRVACLTEFGWAYLRQRLAVYLTRVAIHLDDLRDAGKATWDEVDLWERWNALGRNPGQYHVWLDTPDPRIGFTRRQALQRGMTHLVTSTL